MSWLDDHPNPNLAQQRKPRREEPSGVVAVHTAENAPDFVAFDGGAEAVRDWIGRRDTYGSYHSISDSDSAVRLVDWWNEAFHVGPDHANWHMVGLSAATRADVWPLAPQAWRDGCIDQMAREAADYARWLKAKCGIVIPPRRLTRVEANRRIPGFVDHERMDPARRRDPGDGFPWDLFFTRYRIHAADVLGTDPSEEDDMPLNDTDLAKIRTVVKEEVATQGAITANAVVELLTKGLVGEWARRGFAYVRSLARSTPEAGSIAAEATKVDRAERERIPR